MARIQRLSSISSVTSDWWVVDGILSGLSLLWGEPGSGKSFVAISVAASVASGRPWLGRSTRQGRVVYVAGEGGAEAVARRMRAALLQWGLDPEEDAIPIDIITPGLDLTTGPAELMGLTALSDVPALIVVDTLNRCFSGDENKQEQMGAFIRALDLVRDAYSKVCILIIHHSNKQDEVRGSTVLAGAVDTSWKLQRMPSIAGLPGQVRELVPHKLRERDTLGSEQKLVLNPVGCYDSNGEPELDSFGDVQSSLIVKPHPDDTARATSVMKAGLDLLKQQPVITYVEWRSQTGLEKGQFDSALSYILTYPGQWGQIAQITPGIFGPDPNATP